MNAPRFSAIRQLAFVVPDLDDAARSWARRTGVGPFFCLRHVGIDDVLYRGRAATLDISVALAFSGNLCVELIAQHDDGPSAYRDTVGAGQTGFHHMLVYPDDYDAELARVAAQGVAVAGSGVLRQTGLRFAYLDTRKAIGCMTEIVDRDTPGQWTPMIEATSRWDGVGDPIVEIDAVGATA